ncbi:poly(3-hydroxybutyrate) depolymerase [Povalibacter uvarum]|uniref:Poly(3-hydroxybutyrate) depolymerase n=1 Tax=Povalibacter uvarum TaxID=732238 RepID=A0A841HUA2_9GAMM|nr:prolyl oligopeptidase family serine peptidase [Povalibacter uvarum]MBB6096224.1 poly(3-hydroxybutyrate) depolymerase [Povalibacter uvarum]
MSFTLWRGPALLLSLVVALPAPRVDAASQPLPPDSFDAPLRELWTRGAVRFQRQWLIAGPVSPEAAQRIDPARFDVGVGMPLAPDQQSVRWLPQVSWSNVIDVNALPGMAAGHVTFMACDLTSKTDGSLDLAIGSALPYALWVNGEQVHERSSPAAFTPDQDRVAVRLRAGSNRIVLRFQQSQAGPALFTLRPVPTGAVLQRIDEVSPSLDDSQPGTLLVRTHVAETRGAPVQLKVIAAGGTVIAEQTRSRGQAATFDTTNWRDGAYEIRVATSDAWSTSRVQYLPWFKGDAAAAVKRLQSTAAKAPDTSAGDTLRMLSAMALDRLGGSENQAIAPHWRLVHSPLMEFEEVELEAQGKQGRVRSDGFVRIAYRDEVDNSTQYCRAYLPSGYSRGRAWPLIISLHGFNPANPEYFDWWSVDQRHHGIAQTRETIVVEPHGRGNAQYLGIGDRDVLRCLEEASRQFSVDPDRVYLTGESMGGHGTWAIATRHPDRFAAVAPVYGGWDFRITNVSGPALAPAPTTAWQAYGFERASSFANAENLQHVPLLIIHGDADEAVSVENSRHAVRLLQRWGYDVRYHEMPGWAHEDLEQQGAIADWLLKHSRVSDPRTVRIRATDLAGASAYWLEVLASEQPGEIIRVFAEVTEPGIVSVDTTNVATFRIALPQKLRGSESTLQIVWNGERQKLTDGTSAVVLGAQIKSPALRKRAGLEGPLPAVLATPFAIVVGTTSSDARMRALIRERAQRLADQWQSWQHKPLRMLDDTQVTSAEEQKYSLLLIGGSDANAVTRRFASKLPFATSAKGIKVDGREWHAKDAVLQAVYPSPAASDRYVYVVAPTSTAGMYFWRPQLVHFVRGNPLTQFDWIIQDGRRAPPGTLDPVVSSVASGLFDATWRTRDRLTVPRDEQAAAAWTLRQMPQEGFVPAPAALQAIAGRYELFPGVVVTCRVEGSTLVVDAPGPQRPSLAAESDWVYVNPASGDSVEFIRDAAGNVTSAAIEDQGSVLVAKRVP